MTRRLVHAVLFASACSASNGPAGDRSAPAVEGDAAAAECPAPPTLGVAYDQPGDPRHQVDRLTVWGWSRDGRHFAFETFDAGPGAATCEGVARLFVLDADSDALVPGGYVERRPASPDQEPCDPPDVRVAIADERAALLARHGIEVGHLLAPTRPRALEVSAPRPGARAYAIPLPSGKTATATIEVLGGDRERAFEARGSAVKLDLVVDGLPALRLEPGARRRPYIWNYDLDRGLVFTSPDGSHMALLVATTEVSFEGDRTSWIASTFRIPATW